jgi:hypothetical protein
MAVKYTVTEKGNPQKPDASKKGTYRFGEDGIS